MIALYVYRNSDTVNKNNLATLAGTTARNDPIYSGELRQIIEDIHYMIEYAFLIHQANN